MESLTSQIAAQGALLESFAYFLEQASPTDIELAADVFTEFRADGAGNPLEFALCTALARRSSQPTNLAETEYLLNRARLLARRGEHVVAMTTALEKIAKPTNSGGGAS